MNTESKDKAYEKEASPQETLCQVVGNLNMGGKRGRPQEKKTKPLRNPFELGINKSKFGSKVLKKKGLLKEGKF